MAARRAILFIAPTLRATVLRDNQGLIRKFGAGWPTRLLEA